MNCIFGIDIGGTEIKIGKFYNDLHEKFSIKTIVKENGRHIIDDIIDFIYQHIDGDYILGIGIAVPGPVVDGVVLGAQNIGWKVVELKKILKNKLEKLNDKIVIKILNDANAATFGEMMEDVNKTKNLVMLTLGTGIGGGVVVNGKLIEGATGSTGEVGHIKIYPNKGRKCTCGLEGCLEQYASATGILKSALVMRTNKKTKLNKENLTCKEIFDFAKEGDVIANEVVEKISYDLAIGCSTIADILNPEVILLGGGVSKAGEFLLDKVKYYFNSLAFYSVRSTKIALAKLGNDAGIYGCFHSVMENLNEGV